MAVVRGQVRGPGGQAPVADGISFTALCTALQRRRSSLPPVMRDDRDRRILEALHRLGPDVAHVLEHHPATDGFDSFEEVTHRVHALEEAGYLRAISSDAGGAVGLTEYETVPGWRERLESRGLEAPRR